MSVFSSALAAHQSVSPAVAEWEHKIPAGRHMFMFAGGGTGGHLFPGIALADAIRQRVPAAQFLFVGSDRPIERRIVQGEGLPHLALPVTGLQVCRTRPDRFIWRNWQALQMAQQAVKRLRPRLVIGLGGFTSVPVIWAAHRADVPVILLEQNAVPGKATCWLARWSRIVCTSFAECADWLPREIPVLPCGNPVREEIAALAQQSNLPVESQRQILVLGGSQGADGVNTSVMELVRRHDELRSWTIVHQTGPKQREAVQSTYRDLNQPAIVGDFFEDMVTRYREATVVISRAGATTLSELACAGKASILVPYPRAADDHQRRNAEAFARWGAAKIVEQATASPVTADRLWQPLQTLLTDPGVRSTMERRARDVATPQAAVRIADLVLSDGLAAA